MAPLLPSVIHPVFVHLPITLIPLAALLATLAATKPFPGASPATVLVLALAALGAVGAAFTGLAEEERVEDQAEGTEAGEVLEPPEVLGIATTVAASLAAVLPLWRRRDWATGRNRWAFVALLWTLAILGSPGAGGAGGSPTSSAWGCLKRPEPPQEPPYLKLRVYVTTPPAPTVWVLDGVTL